MAVLPILVAAILINEVQSSDGDWVELHNTGSNTVNVTGWGLSDKTANLFKYRLQGSLAPNGYLKTDVPFGISNNGETLYLTQPGAIAAGEVVTVPAIPYGATWGRNECGDDTMDWCFFGEATPGRANTSIGFAAAEESQPVTFSVPRGVYTKPFELCLTHADASARIYYTLNHDDPLMGTGPSAGTDPSTGTGPSTGTDPSTGTGLLYTGPIQIDRTTVVRAVAVRDGVLGLRGTTTHTYVFPEDIPDQVKPPVAPDVWNDYGSRTATYSVRRESWDPEALNQLPIISITTSDEAMFNPTNGLYCKPVALKGVERAASYEVVTDGTGCNAGIRIQGDSSRCFMFTPKKSFRINFREAYGPKKFNGENVVILRANRFDAWQGKDATYVKDELVRDLQEETSGYSATGDFVHVFLNGLYWGIYNRSQHPDAKLAANKFGGKDDNYNTIKHYNQVTDGDGTAYRAFIANVSNMTWSTLSEQLDLPAYIDYLLVENVVGNREWPDNNFVVTHSPMDGVKYHYFVWDAETAYDAQGADYLGFQPTDKVASPQNIHLALMQRAEYRELYGRHARHHLLEEGGSLTVDAITNRIAALGATLAVPIRAEGARWGTDELTQGYPAVITQLCARAAARHATFVKQLKAYGLLAADTVGYLVEQDPTYPVSTVDPEPVATESVDTITATLGGRTLVAGLASARKFPGVLKADQVVLTVPSLKGGSTWYGGLVARDLPGVKKCKVVLPDGTEPEDASYYLSAKVDTGDGRVTYCVSLPRQAAYDSTRVWVYEDGVILRKPTPVESEDGLNDFFLNNGDGTVSWCVHTYQGLWYRIESGSTLDSSTWTTADPILGTGLPQRLIAPAYPGGGFYRIKVMRPDSETL